MDGLTTDIQRCPDGVELAELPAADIAGLPNPLPARTVFRYRTNRRETQLITIADLENPVVVAFVNATDDQKRQLFFGQFGLDSRSGKFFWGQEPFAPPESWWEELRHDLVLKSQAQFRTILQDLNQFDPAARITAVNAFIARRGLNLQPTFHLTGSQGTPHLVLKSQTLIGFMMMEAAMIVAHGARTSQCEKCGALFLTGHMTGRRSHARFCSDRCRVAAMRARNAERV